MSERNHAKALIAEYLEAVARYDEARKMELCASRLAWKHLAKRVGDDRAYELAGLEFADRRRARASRAVNAAKDRLLAYAKGRAATLRVLAYGVICWGNHHLHLRPANDC